MLLLYLVPLPSPRPEMSWYWILWLRVCLPTISWVLYLVPIFILGTIYRTTISCTSPPAPPLYLVVPISCGYDWVWYYISYPIITVVFRVSCNTVTTRFSPTRHRFSHGLQVKGNFIPPATESFHLVNSTICSTCNIAHTTISCVFYSSVWLFV